MGDYMNNIIEYDKNFNEAIFLGNVENIFAKYHYAQVFKDIDRIKHFISSDLQKQLEIRINSLGDNIQFYDELNLSQTKIIKTELTDDKIIIYVSTLIKYLDYVMDVNDKIITGNNQQRVDKRFILKFEKLKEFEDMGEARKCPGCGANIDVNNNGKCEYCGTIYDLYKKDYILTDIKYYEE